MPKILGNKGPSRLAELAQRLRDAKIALALITDEDSVYYYTGYYDYLHMDFGRPTILVVRSSGDSLLITPSMERDMAMSAAQVDVIACWNDGAGDEWRAELPGQLMDCQSIGIESDRLPAIVERYIATLIDPSAWVDVSPLVSDMRMIKSAEEIQLARHAGQVAGAMMRAASETMAHGVAEYEVALATSKAGTEIAAELLRLHYPDKRMSPNTHFLQIMASGDDIVMPHRRASTRVIQRGDPVFMCFCGMTNFHRFKLGFDRTFWIEEVLNKRQLEIYQVALDSQRAALSCVRSGVAAQDIHAAYADVIQTAGYDYPFRCGRATGFSFLERPQLVAGDTTILKPGMVFAVDGSVTVAGLFRAQVGDSVVVTEDGYELLTHYPNDPAQVILEAPVGKQVVA